MLSRTGQQRSLLRRSTYHIGSRCLILAKQHFSLDQNFDKTTNILIVGTGAAGLTAALRAHHSRLRALVIEKTDKIGGASAWSGGAIWMPNNQFHKAQGVNDSIENALQYLENLIGDVGPASSLERRLAYLKKGPEVISFLHDLGFKWHPTTGYPDYHPDVPGGMVHGRSIEGDVFDLKKLGAWRRHLNIKPGTHIPPMFTDETTKAARFMTSMDDFATLVRIMLRWLTQRLLGRIPATMGRSLVAQLLKLSLDRNTEIWINSPLLELIKDKDGSVMGAVVSHAGQQLRIRVTHGVLLAAGGFAKNKKMRQKYHASPISTEWTSVPSGDTGDAIRVGINAGAETALMDDAWWGPTMIGHAKKEPYFALWDRARPHSICVDNAGQRFMNEAESYVDAVHHQYERNAKVKAIPAWMILDSNFQHRYPISIFPPRALPKAALDSGFIMTAKTLEELATEIGVDSPGLRSTVDRFNEMAKNGVDEDYGRGATAYDRYFGDPKVKPNPNLGPIERAPFYAVKIFPGDLGTKGGLLTDEHGRVLGKDGNAIVGLYGCGNTTASVMGRRYPGSGSTLGPAIIFASLAVDHMAASK